MLYICYYSENIILTIELVHQLRYQCNVNNIKETTLQQYICNSSDLHWVEIIASVMKEEIQTIHKRFITANYPRPFVNSVISQYNNKIKEQ